MLGAFIYAPPVVAEPLRLLLQLVVIPAVTVTGLFLWKQGRLRRWSMRIRYGRPSTPRQA